MNSKRTFSNVPETHHTNPKIFPKLTIQIPNSPFSKGRSSSLVRNNNDEVPNKITDDRRSESLGRNRNKEVKKNKMLK